jgi:hypothetical protein
MLCGAWSARAATATLMFRSNELRLFQSGDRAEKLLFHPLRLRASDLDRSARTERCKLRAANAGINSPPRDQAMALLLTMSALAARVDVRKARIWKARPTVSCDHFSTAYFETVQTAIERLGSGADVDGGAPGTLFRLSGVTAAEQGYDQRCRQR